MRMIVLMHGTIFKIIYCDERANVCNDGGTSGLFCTMYSIVYTCAMQIYMLPDDWPEFPVLWDVLDGCLGDGGGHHGRHRGDRGGHQCTLRFWHRFRHCLFGTGPASHRHLHGELLQHFYCDITFLLHNFIFCRISDREPWLPRRCHLEASKRPPSKAPHSRKPPSKESPSRECSSSLNLSSSSAKKTSLCLKPPLHPLLQSHPSLTKMNDHRHDDHRHPRSYQIVVIYQRETYNVKCDIHTDSVLGLFR